MGRAKGHQHATGTDSFNRVFGASRTRTHAAAKPIVVANNQGRVFNARLIGIGEPYGNGAVNDGDTVLVEIYDATYAGKKDFGEHGQVIGQWGLATVLEHERGVGWDLHGGIAEWKLDADAADALVEQIHAWL